MPDILLSDAQAAALRVIREWFLSGTAIQQIFRLFGYAGTKSTIVKHVIGELNLWRVTLEGKREDLVTTFVEQEYKPFPVAVHDDFFDAMSRICDAEVGTTWPHAAAKKVSDRYTRPRSRRRSYSHWAA